MLIDGSHYQRIVSYGDNSRRLTVTEKKPAANVIVECRRCEIESCEDISYTYLASIECMHSFESSCRLTIFLDRYNLKGRVVSYPRKGPYSSVGEGDVLKVIYTKAKSESYRLACNFVA